MGQFLAPKTRGRYNPGVERGVAGDPARARAPGGAVTLNRGRPRGANEIESWLSAVVECASDAIFAVDVHGTVTAWNPAAERLYGHAAVDIEGRPVRVLIPPDRIEEHERIL